MSGPWLGSEGAPAQPDKPESSSPLSVIPARSLQLVGLGGLAPNTTPEDICRALQELIQGLDIGADSVHVMRSEDTGECMGSALVVLPSTSAAAILLERPFQVILEALFVVIMIFLCAKPPLTVPGDLYLTVSVRQPLWHSHTIGRYTIER
jgi:hypothetical protein